MTTDAVEFRCCDTTWRIHAEGPEAREAVDDARATVHALAARLDAFRPDSRVSALRREGRVQDADVAAIVRRAAEYARRTGGAFDVGRGELERAAKAYLRGDDAPPRAGRAARYRVDGDVVTADGPLDLNGIAKGYIVDRAQDALALHDAVGFVDGGGDIASPTGPVAITAPGDDARWLGVLDTRWNLATSSGWRRRRGAVDHLYHARTGRVGARHDQVTVLARRDCVEADVLATTLAVLPLDEGLALAERWPGVEALVADGDVLYATSGMEDHVWRT